MDPQSALVSTLSLPLWHLVSVIFTWQYRRSYWHWGSRRVLTALLHRPSTHLSSSPTQSYGTLSFCSCSLARLTGIICPCLQSACYSKRQHNRVYFRLISSCPYFKKNFGHATTSRRRFSTQSVREQRFPPGSNKHTVKPALSQRTLIWSCIKKTKKRKTIGAAYWSVSPQSSKKKSNDW